MSIYTLNLRQTLIRAMCKKDAWNWGSIDWLTPPAHTRSNSMDVMELIFFLFRFFYLFALAKSGGSFFFFSREMWQSNQKAAIHWCNFEIGARES